MLRGIFICCLALFCLDRGAQGQADKTQPPAASPAIELEYRKFEEVESFVRRRNAQNYAISSAKGIDEASYVNAFCGRNRVILSVTPSHKRLHLFELAVFEFDGW